MPILTVASSKGGVGKTLTASSLAAVLGELDGPVLAVDADSNCSLTRSFGHDVSADSDLGSLLTVADLSDFASKIIASGCAGVDLLPANGTSMRTAERIMTGDASSTMYLKQALQPLRDRYRWIIVDTPAALNNLTLAAVVAADAVIGVYVAEPLSIEGIAQLFDWMSKYRASGLVDAPFLGMLNNMYEKRRLLTGEVNATIEQLLEERQCRVFEARIPRLVRVSEATAVGAPVTTYDPDSPGSLALRQFVREVMTGMAALA